MSDPHQSRGGRAAGSERDEETSGFTSAGDHDFMWLGPDTMGPLPVGYSFNTELSASQPFAGFGSYAGTSVEPLLPMEGQQGFRAQAPIFQSPGYVPTQDFGAAMSSFPIPEAHIIGNDSGGNDGYVLNNTVPSAVPQEPAAATTSTVPRQLQLPSEVLEARQAEAGSGTQPEPSSDAAFAPLLLWHPSELRPEDVPELDPTYAVTDPANPPRVDPNLPMEAWLPRRRLPRAHGNVDCGAAVRAGREWETAEQDRLDLQHMGLKTLLGGRLFQAPIKNPKHVLDLATGTGIWPIEFAELFPDAQIIGTDLSQIQPDHKPPNVTFVREDSEEEWCYDHKFDYIHARAVFTCFDDPRGVMERAFENLKPGGYIEYLDCYGTSGSFDGSLRGTALERLGLLCQQGAAKNGRDLLVAMRYKEWLEEVGFVDVVERKLAWPYGGWARDPRLKLAGKFCQRDIYDGVSGIAHVMLQKAGFPIPAIEEYIAEVRSNLVNPAIHAYLPVISVYGRKPEAEEEPRQGQPEASSMPPPTTKRTGFMPHEFLPEDFPEIDPLYTKPGTVSAAAIPPSQSGIPHEAWVPAEIYRESSGGSVVESNSIVEENGRTYHGYKDRKYWVPNDPTEQERLDLQHCTCTLLLHNRLYLAPLQSPRHVLDIATGTGLWAMEFGLNPSSRTPILHPGAHIIGTDLSKIQPENPPDNIEFVRDDAEEPWEFGPTRFDYVHVRFVFSCFNDPRFVMRQAFDHMAPGGWIEYMDSTTNFASMDGSIEGTTIEKWGELMRAGAALRGRDVDVTRFYKQWLEEIGCKFPAVAPFSKTCYDLEADPASRLEVVDVQERKFAGVLGPWCRDPRMKHVGRLGARNLYDNISGISYRLLEAQGYSQKQIEEFATKFQADIVNPSIHAYCPLWVVYGRKPHAWESKAQSGTSGDEA
ncbi:hypothetical protein PG993_007080 [Apiospora rasikravindrae]|uniref:S-adenosyl-L-methionine-dependent methyltransferase n=1 Tax=Apiospora rasikravindrae TaxID=990691 RepID=A0ABR1SWG2_9PEZI